MVRGNLGKTTAPRGGSGAFERPWYVETTYRQIEPKRASPTETFGLMINNAFRISKGIHKGSLAYPYPANLSFENSSTPRSQSDAPGLRNGGGGRVSRCWGVRVSSVARDATGQALVSQPSAGLRPAGLKDSKCVPSTQSERTGLWGAGRLKKRRNLLSFSWKAPPRKNRSPARITS
jgi:hypothetical protein